MSLANSRLVSLNFGEQGRFSCEIDGARIVASHAAPEPNAQLTADLRTAIASPLEFPPLEQAIMPNDRVALALDRHTPGAAHLVAAAFEVVQKRGVAPENVVVIQPAGRDDSQTPDPRERLAAEVRHQVQWKIHDPEQRSDCTYLGTTASGERIYLACAVVDADVIVSLGAIAYDPLLGYRGTNSVFYPGLSSSAAGKKSHGQGHSELVPEDIRPLRQLIDEVGWILGAQFSVQVIPSAGGGVSQVLAGASDSVMRKGCQLLDESWLVELPTRPGIVVAAIDRDTGGHGWDQVGAALAAARSLVARDGKIVVLSELTAELDAGMELIRECQSPRDALQPLRTTVPVDLIAATQLADAADWANVYLLSKLESDLVEELFLIPIEEEKEIIRILNGNETCAFLDAAQHTFGQINAD